MRIAVNHLTRMSPPHICVAGIDLDTGRHVRPVLHHGRLDTSALRRKGGPFDIAAVVDIGKAWRVGEPPEVEDHRFDPRHARHKSDLAPEEFWGLLQGSAVPKLGDIFGRSLKQQGRSFAVDAGGGVASLGCLLVGSRPVLAVDMFGAVRLTFGTGRTARHLPVTDLRLFNEDLRTKRLDVIAQVAARIEAGVPLVLSVGLTRAWQRPGDTAERHWLQVNNIHLGDDPAWTGRA